MRIAIATGIFPPEIGGPAYYAAALRDALERQGHTVDVVLYGGLKKLPPGVRHLLYAAKLTWHARRTDAIIAFDTYSVGLPAAVAGMVVHKPVVARIGGDFMWEMYTERTRDLIPLPQVYDLREKWSRKERAIFWLQGWVIRRVDLAFSCEWIRDIWRQVYVLDASHTHVIENAIPPKEESVAPTKKNYLFYTRQLALKNHAAFRRAFAKAKEVCPEIELEEGMVPHAELMQRMRAGYAIVLPSISDVTPNYITDAIRCGKPFLLTKNSGFAERFKDYGVIVDPLSEEDMTRGILALADDETYAAYARKIAAFDGFRSYDDIAREFVALLERR